VVSGGSRGGQDLRREILSLASSISSFYGGKVRVSEDEVDLSAERGGGVGMAIDLSVVSRAGASAAVAVSYEDAVLVAAALVDGRAHVLTTDDLVAFAQLGWHYPLEDDEDTRREIAEWLEARRDGA
jgi:hypothetical protein